VHAPEPEPTPVRPPRTSQESGPRPLDPRQPHPPSPSYHPSATRRARSRRPRARTCPTTVARTTPVHARRTPVPHAHRPARRRPQRTVRRLEALLVHLLKSGEVVGQHPLERRGLGPAWTVGRRAPAPARSMPGNEHHDRCRTAPRGQCGPLMTCAQATGRHPYQWVSGGPLAPPPSPSGRAGKPSPFRAPSNAHGCPRMPARSRANFLPFFAMPYATIASC